MAGAWLRRSARPQVGAGPLRTVRLLRVKPGMLEDAPDTVLAFAKLKVARQPRVNTRNRQGKGRERSSPRTRAAGWPDFRPLPHVCRAASP